jgi:hypothetical protein
VYGSSVTSLAREKKVRAMRVPKAAVLVVVVVVVVAVAMGLMVGALLMVAVKKAVVLVAVGGVLVLVLVAVTWNCVWGRRGLLGIVRGYYLLGSLIIAVGSGEGGHFSFVLFLIFLA